MLITPLSGAVDKEAISVLADEVEASVSALAICKISAMRGRDARNGIHKGG